MQFPQILRRLFHGRRTEPVQTDAGRQRPGADTGPARGGKEVLEKAELEKRAKWKKRH